MERNKLQGLTVELALNSAIHTEAVLSVQQLILKGTLISQI